MTPCLHIMKYLSFHNGCLHVKFRRIRISQLVNKMLFPGVAKSGTSCYHLVTKL